MTDKADFAQIEDIDIILDELSSEIAELDMRVIGETLGVAQAIDQMHNALGAITESLDDRDFCNASKLGYEDAASAFIFLQRTLAGLQQLEADKAVLIQKAALRYTKIYEEAAPFIEAQLQNFQPKKI